MPPVLPQKHVGREAGLVARIPSVIAWIVAGIDDGSVLMLLMHIASQLKYHSTLPRSVSAAAGRWPQRRMLLPGLTAITVYTTYCQHPKRRVAAAAAAATGNRVLLLSCWCRVMPGPCQSTMMTPTSQSLSCCWRPALTWRPSLTSTSSVPPMTHACRSDSLSFLQLALKDGSEGEDAAAAAAAA